ncbi:MAG: threonylcarbamoyl-AMP synthase [Candidatus Omnitrophica bacterium]|nr:threonylcarbamoyl-AMP synthase [Candidatus Omnitrophota bacterium]
MKTEIINIDPQDLDLDKIKKAAMIITEGGIVAFPTETVYGLAADYSNSEAVKRIFTIKRRPEHKPLTIQIHDINSLNELVSDIPVFAYKLMSAFWPGPLTLIFRAKKGLPAYLNTGAQDTVGVRIPNNKIALDLIRESGKPIVAPSANISGRPPAKDVKEVLNDFDGLIDMVVDGGEVELGVASTVLDLTQEPFAVLREGAISNKDIQGVQN